MPRPGDDLLARTRKAYAALKSYADTGTVATEYALDGGRVAERHTFKTYYRAPRLYYFEFNKDKEAGADRFVIWSDAENFHTWWASTGAEDAYPRGSGDAAFAIASGPTVGSLMVTAPLLFQGARLVGALDEIKRVESVTEEALDGRPCHKITAHAESTYGATGYATSERQVIVWVDTKTLLVRKMFSDTPKGGPPGLVMRTTVTIDPRADPLLEDGVFKFTVPR